MLRILTIEGFRFDSSDPESQFRAIYKEIFAILDANGFRFKENGVKSWNYIRNILKNYSTFNQVRDQAFERVELYSNYPAGTGIDCELSGNAAMVMGLYAIAPKATEEISIRSGKTPYQCEAHTYGPKFSRAKIVEIPGRGKKVFISGTASV